MDVKLSESTGNRFYPAECTDCGWKGCSSSLLGGEQTMAGDYDDVYCPKCESDRITEQQSNTMTTENDAVIIKEEMPGTCPFCGFEHAQLLEQRGLHYVHCSFCKAEGPLFDDADEGPAAEEAVLAWNKVSQACCKSKQTVERRQERLKIATALLAGCASNIHVEFGERTLAAVLKMTDQLIAAVDKH